jgi:hypothetical protein
MTIDRQKNRWVCVCDACDELVEGETGEEFDAFVATRKAEGWRFSKRGDSWEHQCPACAGA